jgi:hypothetical protein
MTAFVKRAASALLAATVLLATPAVAQDNAIEKNPAEKSDRRVEIGALTCTVLPNTRRNYIVRSTAQVDCVFKPLKGEKEQYVGVTGIQLGLDLSVRENEKLRFAVVDSRKVEDTRPVNALAGKYFGASASASVTYGIGAAALVGGSRKELALVPLSVETIRGLGVSAGVGYLYLEPAEQAEQPKG